MPGTSCWLGHFLLAAAATNVDPDSGTGEPELDGITLERTIQERAWTSPIWYESGS